MLWHRRHGQRFLAATALFISVVRALLKSPPLHKASRQIPPGVQCFWVAGEARWNAPSLRTILFIDKGGRRLVMGLERSGM